MVLSEAGQRERGAPIVRALHAGLDGLDLEPDVIVNVDADVTMEPDYFERLLEAFARDPSLGIASGSAWELGQRGLAPAFRDRWHGLGRDPRLSMGVSAGRAAARGTPRLGRGRPARSPGTRLDHEDVY